MRRFLLIFVGLLVLSAFLMSFVSARQGQFDPTASPPDPSSPQVVDQNPLIIAPKPGQALQGNVSIIVDTTVQRFQSVELTFTYTGDPTKTRFLIFQGIQPVVNQPLVQWDTSVITDGDYDFQMQITFLDGSQQTVSVPGVRVRNYTAIEADTPTPAPTAAPAAPAQPPTPTITPTHISTTPPPASTPLPPNPIELNQLDVWMHAGKGALAIIGFFALAGLYRAIQSLRRQQ